MVFTLLGHLELVEGVEFGDGVSEGLVVLSFVVHFVQGLVDREVVVDLDSL